MPPSKSVARPKLTCCVAVPPPRLGEEAAEVGEAQRGARGVTQPLHGRAQAPSKGSLASLSLLLG